MTITFTAIYDGEVLRPDEPIDLEPNTRVQITIEPIPTQPIRKRKYSFIKTALSLNLQGPPDWSARIDDYLYGQDSNSKT